MKSDVPKIDTKNNYVQLSQKRLKQLQRIDKSLIICK